jgi:hypothetical protein
MFAALLQRAVTPEAIPWSGKARYTQVISWSIALACYSGLADKTATLVIDRFRYAYDLSCRKDS